MADAQSKLLTARTGQWSSRRESILGGPVLSCEGFARHCATAYASSEVVKNDTTSSRSRKMFRQQILAVRLGQTKAGLPEEASARVAAIELGIPAQFLSAFLVPRTMLHNEPECTAASLISFISHGALSPLISMDTLEVVAMKRGTRE